MYIHPIQIGNLIIPNNIFLAPMAGITDMPYRKLCKEFGAGMMYTEMVSSKAINYGSEKTAELYEIFDWEHPIGVQLFGSDPLIMANTAKTLSEVADIIDINMGCPANKIVKNGEGSALMKNLSLAKEVIEAVVASSKVPVTVKMRKGWNDDQINVVELAQIAENSGAKLITVHGRTREQFYSGTADLEIVKEVKKNVSIPVIGNGDIDSPESAKQFFDKTECDGIMIGRASQGNPWIFEKLLRYLTDGVILKDPSLKDKIDMALRHLKLAVEYKGEYVAIREMRKILSAYIKNIPKAAELRNSINRADSYEMLQKIFKDLEY